MKRPLLTRGSLNAPPVPRRPRREPTAQTACEAATDGRGRGAVHGQSPVLRHGPQGARPLCPEAAPPAPLPTAARRAVCARVVRVPLGAVGQLCDLRPVTQVLCLGPSVCNVRMAPGVRGDGFSHLLVAGTAQSAGHGAGVPPAALGMGPCHGPHVTAEETEAQGWQGHRAMQPGGARARISLERLAVPSCHRRALASASRRHGVVALSTRPTLGMPNVQTASGLDSVQRPRAVVLRPW